MKRYAVIIEETEAGFSAYIPDLPGCVATGETEQAVEENIREAILLHLEGMREEGIQIPPPRTRTRYVTVE